MAKIIGREAQQKELRDLYESKNAEFVAVYGRRRVGKTFLIREMFKDNFTFYHTGLSIYDEEKPVTTADQLRHFYHSLKQHGADVEHVPSDWMEAIYMLEDYLIKEDNGSRQVVFIDELPWLDTNGSKILMALDAFWNGWAAGRDNIMFIVCGSAASWMIKTFLKNAGPFYGRTSNVIKLSPFTLHESEAFLQSKNIELNRYDIAQAYMALGGIPYYLNYFQKGLSLAQNIDRVIFDKNAKLKFEFKLLFKSLFKMPENYVEIIKYLSTKHCGFTRDDIAEHIGVASGGKLSDILLALVESDFITTYTAFDANKNETLYRLIDPFFRFYLNFVEKRNVIDNHFWQNNITSSSIRSWSGIAFEELCFIHTDQIKQSISIGGITTSVAPFTLRGDKNHDGMQCDLIIVRNDRIVNLCEMKFTSEPFIIDKAYDMVLRNRISLLRSRLTPTQNLHLTFVTTFGVKQNMYSGIVQSEVTLDDLFS